MSGNRDGNTASHGVPLATYRLQFNQAFTFRDAEALVPYLRELGITHVYASPYLAARAGSSHGYDITDHNSFNPEIGDEADFQAFVAALGRHDMGHILDFVPNHMGIGGADNRWWLDVLEWGQFSPYADFFDIDWRPAKVELRGKILVPFLGDHYGTVLESGELRLAFDKEDGSFSAWYHQHKFPIAPRHYARILDPRWTALRGGAQPGERLARDLDQLIAEFRALRVAGGPARRRAAVRERAEALKAALAQRAAADAELLRFIETNVGIFNGAPGDPHSFVPLHRLLEAQAYRLSYWRVAVDEINYRRFFDINDLAGLRMERPDLFDLVHRLIFRLIAEGRLQGLRVDHIDGLFDPKEYCRRVQTGVAGLLGVQDRPPGALATAEDQAASAATSPLYVIVEKILAQHERVRQDWEVAGTTGYEFVNLLNGLFVDPAGERALDRTYHRFVERALQFDDVLYDCKQQVMGDVLASELHVLANELNRISEANWSTRDFTLNGLRAALKEIIACFPVYRTYVTGRSPTTEDRRDIDWAVAQARRRNPTAEPSIYDFIHAVLITDLVRRPRSGYSRRQVVRFAMRFQQYTGPVMAKSLEDTSFYRYNRLVSLNEVGGDPRRFGVSVSAFHHLNQERMRHWPHNMLATATHDTKRGEDVRVRINVLSEIPQDWGGRVRLWARLNRAKKKHIDGAPAPTANDEYLLYQMLLGAWPAALTPPAELDPDHLAAFGERVQNYMIKAVREAKLNSSWANPNLPYEEATADFVLRILETSKPNRFLDDLLPFQARVALVGAVNSLAQTTLKLTVPGVPDTYQGSELWDLNMVDPDNRRPVDYARRVDMLRELQGGLRSAEDRGETGRRLLMNWPDGRIKLFVVWRLLNLRLGFPDLFQSGEYLPLASRGERADHVCAFARVQGQRCCVVVVPRLAADLLEGAGAPALRADAWADTAVDLPAELDGRRFRNVFTGEPVEARPANDGAGLAIPELFRGLPVAVLTNADGPI